MKAHNENSKEKNACIKIGNSIGFLLQKMYEYSTKIYVTKWISTDVSQTDVIFTGKKKKEGWRNNYLGTTCAYLH